MYFFFNSRVFVGGKYFANIGVKQPNDLDIHRIKQIVLGWVLKFLTREYAVSRFCMWKT